MGRRKITIKPLSDLKLKYTTFNKRKTGLLKKAAEISMLCDLKLLLIFEDTTGSIIRYSTHKIFDQFEYFKGSSAENMINFCSDDYPNFFKIHHYKSRKLSEKIEQKQSISNEKIIIRSTPAKAPKIECVKNEANDSFELKSKKRFMNKNNKPNTIMESCENQAIKVNIKNKTQESTAEKTSSNESPRFMQLDTYIASNNQDLNENQDIQNSETKSICKNRKNLKLQIPIQSKEKDHIQYVNKPNESQNNHEEGFIRQQQSQSPYQFTMPLLSPMRTNSPFGRRLNKIITPTPKTFNKTSNIFSFDSLIFSPMRDHPKNPDIINITELPNSQYNKPSIQRCQNRFNDAIEMGITEEYKDNLLYNVFIPQANNINTNNNSSLFRVFPSFDLDSPYTRSNMFNKIFYPSLYPLNEEGFSPFIRNNFKLDISNSNNGSAIARKDRSNVFNFMTDNKNNDNIPCINLTDQSQQQPKQLKNRQMMNHNPNIIYDEDVHKPRKKIKI